MKFIYTPLDGMNETLKKYDISFKAGEAVEVKNLNKASKMQKIPYFSACLEVETVEDEITDELKAEYKELFGKNPRSDSKLETILEAINKAKADASE